MKAPEKIYLFENSITETPDDRWLSKRSAENDIEYTRTDAFIERAREWLRRNLSNYCDVTREDFELFIDDFRKYLKEE